MSAQGQRSQRSADFARRAGGEMNIIPLENAARDIGRIGRAAAQPLENECEIDGPWDDCVAIKIRVSLGEAILLDKQPLHALPVRSSPHCLDRQRDALATADTQGDDASCQAVAAHRMDRAGTSRCVCCAHLRGSAPVPRAEVGFTMSLFVRLVLRVIRRPGSPSGRRALTR
jgi:hypothetical protein